MLIKKLKTIAQVIGMVGLVLAAIHGILTLLEGKAAWAAPLLQWGDSSIPLVVNYQGHLRDPEGVLLSGSYDMIFRIYDDVIAPTPLYEETQNGVAVRNGYFSVLLGNNNPPGNTLPPTLFNSPDRFVGITVAPYAEMIPRQRFASVAYAFQAQQAQNAVTATEAAHATSADNADHLDNLDSSDFARYSLRARDGDPIDAVYVDETGKVGIGTTYPFYSLDVRGDIEWTGDLKGFHRSSTTISRNRTTDGAGTSSTTLGTVSDRFCALDLVKIEETDTPGEYASCQVFPGATDWLLLASLGQGGSDQVVTCGAVCLTW